MTILFSILIAHAIVAFYLYLSTALTFWALLKAATKELHVSNVDTRFIPTALGTLPAFLLYLIPFFNIPIYNSVIHDSKKAVYEWVKE